MIATLVLLAAGLLGGFVGGLIGIGGGIIFVLVLPLVLPGMGVPVALIPQYTIANSLFATMFSAAAAQLGAGGKDAAPLRVVLWIALPAMVLQALVLQLVVQAPWYSRPVFLAVVVVLMLLMVLRLAMQVRRLQASLPAQQAPRPMLVLTGLLSGSAAALSGLGGGVVIIPMLNHVLKVQVRQANLVSLGVIAITSASATVYHLLVQPVAQVPYAQGLIVFPAALGLAAGVALGSPLGVRASRRVSARVINYSFLVFMGVNVLIKLWEIVQELA